MALRRPCLDCGKPVRGASRCPRHTAARDKAKAAKRPLLRANASKVSNAALVSEHRATVGDWCPGLPGERPAHPAADLVADHVIEVAAGGQELQARRVVRCRSCNSARSANVRRDPFSP